jgi:predicted HTH domain antitoxin
MLLFLSKFTHVIRKINMKTLTLQLPDAVDEKDVRMQLASYLFEKGIMTSGQAADLVGISKREFLETVGQYGVTIFGEDVDDIEKIING